jgi:uroporphyrinogen decarboxylase
MLTQAPSLIRLRRRMKPSQSSQFIKACRRESASHTPVWLMRQAGRYMPEYRSVRDKVSFLELCKTPELACKVTVEAAEILNTDAAIIFADILLITEPMGFQLEFGEGEGPAIRNPFRSVSDLERLRRTNPKESLAYVLKAIELTKKELKPHIPLIGFAGAPFTVASYIIEGGSSKNFENVKKLMRSEPLVWHPFMEHIARETSEYLRAQIDSGADAIQLFDSWIGCLAPHEYRSFVYPHVKQIFDALPKDVPAIYFGTNTGPFLEDFADTGAGVIGIDFHTSLKDAFRRLGNRALQGNLDPTVLFSSRDVIAKETDRILKEANGQRGFIFNLGHGILPKTPVDNVKFLVEYVHEKSSK